MPFYKRDGEQLLTAESSVSGPGFALEAAQKDTYEYPVQGWYWFDNLDQALAAPQLKSSAAVVKVPMQFAQLAMLEKNVLDAVEAAIAGLGREAQISWSRAVEVERTHPLIEVVGKQVLGWTDPFIDELFALAAAKQAAAGA